MTTQDNNNATPDYILNKIIFSGNTAAAPEFAYTKNGKAVAKTVVFSTRRWTDKNSGEKHEKTTKFKVVAWGELAERIHNQVGKGDFVEFEAQMETPETWLSKKEVNEDGTPKLDTINIAQAFEFRVIYKKGTDAAAPSSNAPLGTNDRDPAEPIDEGFGDIPF